MKTEARAAFDHPSTFYRAAPFWSWNNRLDPDQLCRQIDVFKKMGLGGFHMHVRVGLDTEYLGTEYMAAVRRCVDKARAEGMLAWLYDEDRWPSGYAGGLVTQDKRWRERHLLFTPVPYAQKKQASSENAAGAACGRRTENGRLLAVYDIGLDADGFLKSAARVADPALPPAAGIVRWYAYLETAEPSARLNHQTYVDVLNPDAIQRFIEVTHEAYLKEVGSEFGKTVPAIFTDEPHFVHMQNLGRASDRTDVVIPFTDDLPETYCKTYRDDLLDHLPELFWDLPDKAVSVHRYRYHDHVCERFAEAFADQIGTWCADHNIAFTGHLALEHHLPEQTGVLGEAMRHYRSFHIPGIDMLCDGMELATAKQAQSAARQYGRPGVLSELYGVTNWSFDFAGHKRQGDWQTALGVLFRVPHLSMVSMAGEAKRDYPASISYQSPWWEEYRVVEDHFARVCALMSRGRPLARIGVLHPIESSWLCWGPREQSIVEQAERDDAFLELTRLLLFGFADFDFISESLLPAQYKASADRHFQVGEMAYDVIVAPNLRTIRSSTLARLKEFVEKGGTVLFVGEIPSLVDAVPSSAPGQLAEQCLFAPKVGPRLLEMLQPYCDVRLLDARGDQANAALYQMRQEDDSRYVFVCNTQRDQALPARELRIRGEWQGLVLDSLTGRDAPLAATYTDGWTCIPCDLPAHGSLLLALEPGRAAAPCQKPATPGRELGRLADPVPVSLSEPNVLVLDYAAWKIDDGDWSEITPVLEIDKAIAKALGIPARGGSQPWCDREPLRPLADVHLKMTFQSRVPVQAPQLALEDIRSAAVTLDGRAQNTTPTGYFTDEAIQTMRLEPFEAGEHVLEVTLSYHRKTCVECMYLLGDFGVEVRGRNAVITPPVRTLSFGNWVHQGLPFYAGKVTYHCVFTAGPEAVCLHVPHFEGALVKAALDEGESVPLAFAPFRVDYDAIPGEHRVDLTVYGNRVNAFGQLHNRYGGGKTDRYYWGPGAWRTTGEDWLDEYQLWPMGILGAPRLLEMEAGV